ncbi:MAG: hypothetical protein ACOYXB_06525 [Bacteroidota bacterium]
MRIKVRTYIIFILLSIISCEKLEEKCTEGTVFIPGYHVPIPDANFKEKLIAAGYDSDCDCEISFQEAEVVDSLNLFDHQNVLSNFGKIEDLTGIEAFVNLVFLDCSNNKINGPLDLSSNPKLKYLKCYDSGIKGTIDLSHNIKLEYINCCLNEIDTLNIIGLKNLRDLNIGFTNITNIDLSTNINLYSFEMLTYALTELDITNNINLEILKIGAPLTNIDFSRNIHLKELLVGGTQVNITELDLSNCSELKELTVSYFDVNEIDISQSRDLEKLSLYFLPSLVTICVWELPFPSSVEVDNNLADFSFVICN